jgi:hypothetical protein
MSISSQNLASLISKVSLAGGVRIAAFQNMEKSVQFDI